MGQKQAKKGHFYPKKGQKQAFFGIFLRPKTGFFAILLQFTVTLLQFCYSLKNPETLAMTGFEGILLQCYSYF